MGWIKLDRKILDHWLWQKKPFSEGQAWIDLLLMANHEDQKFLSGSSVVEGKRGCIYKSMLFLANRWGWDRKKVKRFLMTLQMDNMITQNATTQGTTICIVKYGDFQNQGTTKRTTNGQRSDKKRATNGHIQEYKNKSTTYSKEEKKAAAPQSCPSGIDPNYDPEPGVDPNWDYYKQRGGY